jgi:hypothetical protein
LQKDDIIQNGNAVGGTDLLNHLVASLRVQRKSARRSFQKSKVVFYGFTRQGHVG